LTFNDVVNNIFNKCTSFPENIQGADPAMKTMKRFITTVFAALCLVANLQATSLKQFNFSVWTDYTGVKFSGLTQEEKTIKLQNLFEDKVNFVTSHNARRVLVKILNPAEFDFFKTENYDATRDDNFYYWALKLSQSAEIEAVFDTSEFNNGTQSWKDRFLGFAADWLKVERVLGEFRSLEEKLSWVSFMNEMASPNGRGKQLIKGVTIDPKDMSDATVQLLINLLDQYKHNASEDLPANPYSGIRMAAYLTLDQKELAFCNLSQFPLRTDLRGQKPDDIGVDLPENFPTEGPSYLAPQWRSRANQSLLDTVYLKMGDKRLIETVYQNHELMPDPAEYNKGAINTLVSNLSNNFQGIPFVKGPGFISSPKGSLEVNGLYTFFRTAGGRYKQGQLIEGSSIEVRSPDLTRNTQKVVCEKPKNNISLKLTSTFSTTQDVEKAQYYITATPVPWNYPKTSNALRSKIYFVFDTAFKPDEERFLGNWHLSNFLDFLETVQLGAPRGRGRGRHPSVKRGFLHETIFTDFNGKAASPVNNLVLYDFTTIPNGYPYPECNWQLGNDTHL